MKAKQTGFGILVMMVVLSALFLFSCSKKEIKSEGIVSKPPAPVGEDGDKNKKQVRLKEPEPADQGMKEKTLSEEEARRLREAAEKARFESDDIYFEFDQYILSDTAKQNLNKKAKWLQAFPSAKALIEGHCDERGSAEYNLALGQKRADAAMQYVVSLGINANRISTISYGKEKPLVPEHTEAAWTKNRRAHFVLK